MEEAIASFLLALASVAWRRKSLTVEKEESKRIWQL